jgi:hypothetical protein
MYDSPPPQDKLSPLEVSRDIIEQTLFSCPDERKVDKFILEKFAGISPAVAREIVYRGFGEVDTVYMSVTRAEIIAPQIAIFVLRDITKMESAVQVIAPQITSEVLLNVVKAGATGQAVAPKSSSDKAVEVTKIEANTYAVPAIVVANSIIQAPKAGVTSKAFPAALKEGIPQMLYVTVSIMTRETKVGVAD